MPNGMTVRLFLEFFVALQQEALLFQKKALIIRAFLDALWANPPLTIWSSRFAYEFAALRIECCCGGRVQRRI